MVVLFASKEERRLIRYHRGISGVVQAFEKTIALKNFLRVREKYKKLASTKGKLIKILHRGKMKYKWGSREDLCWRGK